LALARSMPLARFFKSLQQLTCNWQYLPDSTLHVGAGVDFALELHCGLLIGLEDGYVGRNNIPIVWCKLICEK